MNEEELDSIQELIERKLLMAEVMGGLTSQDKKFINLWNYAMQLQNNWNELKKYAKEHLYFYIGYQGEDLEEDLSIKDLLDKMQELEQGKDEN